MYEKITKVVVCVPLPQGAYTALEEKTFEAKNAPLKVTNTDAGFLIVEESKFRILAVFKEWLYWEDASNK